jgi:pyrimidine deaminase RibD-like protein
MENNEDLGLMKEAITWANDCLPTKPSIPKVGAIIAKGNKVLGRGRRGNGREGDGEHAEWNAFEEVTDKSTLAGATLYTTLEPCTPGVRTKPLSSCAELIIQHQIKRVLVGMLDPNQGVTGKGLLRLQEAGVEVALFPHDLSKEIRAINAAFTRSQQTLSATIVSPTEGEELRRYDSSVKHTVRFECKNSPGPNTYLLIYTDGLYRPQPGPFREIGHGVWEIDAHFGSTGDYSLQLVTAGDLGNALVRYYRKVVRQNLDRRERLGQKLRGEIDLSVLGGDYPGIEMNGLLKGLQLEASVAVKVVPTVNLLATSAEPTTIARGKTLKITYEIECYENVVRDLANGIWLGASFRDVAGKLFFNTGEDKPISLTKGKNTHDRNFTIAKDAALGDQKLQTNIWRGAVGNSSKSKWIGGTSPIPIKVVD